MRKCRECGFLNFKSKYNIARRRTLYFSQPVLEGAYDGAWNEQNLMVGFEKAVLFRVGCPRRLGVAAG